MKPEQKEIVLAGIQDLQGQAVAACWDKYAFPGKVAGCIVAIAGGAVLQVVIPGFGQWIAIAAGVLIAGSVDNLAAREGDRIEDGNIEAINAYLDEATQKEILLPYIEQAAEVGKAGKKTRPAMGQTTNGSPSPAVSSNGSDKTSSPSKETGVNSDSAGNPSTDNGFGTSESKSGIQLPRQIAQLDEAAPHLFMVGRTREGKSETLKHLIGREDRVWYLTSKATDKVPSHWRGYRVGGPDLPKQIRWLHSQWEAAFLRHLEGADQQREWFVIDEAVGILQSLKTKGAKGVADSLRGFIVEVLTSGAGVHAFVGILSQTGNAGPIGVDEDLLKNSSIVGCGKRKKSQMLKAFLKLTDLKVTREQEQEILSLEGYWQLWENDGPCLSQVPLSELSVKDVEVCPVPPEEDEKEADSIKICVQQVEPKSLAERILDHMIKHGEAKTAREITIACTRSEDNQRATVDEVKQVLENLIAQEKIYGWVDGKTERYQITGTP
ncbi:MAG: hypothetical protein F6K42_25985 [Leptolyngbya sp. SIO1D8]|nr:hypothetical protein [Leptolyngbya sp. SIO1D8]